MSGRRSAFGWAEEQRALRARAAAPGFAPSTVPVDYRLVTASGTGDVPGVGGLVPRLALLGVAVAVMLVEDLGVVRYVLVAVGFLLIVRWFWPPAVAGARLALYAAGAPLDGVPTLVVAVGGAPDVPSAGRARAFGDVAPGGVLGVLVGDVTLWPTAPPRAGSGRDRA